MLRASEATQLDLPIRARVLVVLTHASVFLHALKQPATEEDPGHVARSNLGAWLLGGRNDPPPSTLAGLIFYAWSHSILYSTINIYITYEYISDVFNWALVY